MKRISALQKSLALLTALVCLTGVLSGCGTSYDKAAADQDMNGAYFDTSSASDAAANSKVSLSNTYSAAGQPYAEEEVEEPAAPSTEAIPGTRKIIYTSSFEMQTTAFDETVSALDGLCEAYGAYYEHSETYGYAERGNRNGSFTIRVPFDQYQSFRHATGELGTVVSSSENNEDVSEKYYDTEARLASAKLREERLLDILSKAESLDNVLLLESELANVRYEIESLSGSLRKYDSLIEYSTIYVYIYEVSRPVTVQTLPKTFGERLAQAATGGFRNFTDGFQDAMVELTYSLPTLILLIVFVVVVVVVVRSIRKKYKKKIQAAISSTQQTDKKES